MQKSASASAIPSKQFKFRADPPFPSLSLSFSSLLEKRSIHFVLSNWRILFSSCSDSQWTAGVVKARGSVPPPPSRASWVPKVEAKASFSWDRMPILFGNFKQLLESSHVPLQRRNEGWKKREFPLILFNSTERPMLLESRAKECNECLIFPDDDCCLLS